MEKTLKIINQMQKEGVFKKYSIAGGIAAIFYIEPITTFDLDIFVILNDDKSDIISLSPIYQWIEKKGYQVQNEQIVMEGIPVQFIPVYNLLIHEAVENAVEKKYKGTTTYVLRAEYLFAIMLQTHRPKDVDRMIKFLDQVKMSDELIKKILIKYQLNDQFNSFMKKYYEK
jgi:hypothetical protein